MEAKRKELKGVEALEYAGYRTKLVTTMRLETSSLQLGDPNMLDGIKTFAIYLLQARNDVLQGRKLYKIMKY